MLGNIGFERAGGVHEAYVARLQQAHQLGLGTRSWPRWVRHPLNDAGSPTQNAYIESFNGKFRDECLNEQWFESLVQARHEIARWRCDYNEVRPHSAIGRIPHAQFAAAHRRLADDAQYQPEIK